VIDRCGVIAGPWQMGKVDQGVFTHWMLAFYFRRPISYIGVGGTGKQVRDLLHVADLADLVDDQLLRPAHWAGAVVNVGGGVDCSLSLREASAICREITEHDVSIGRVDDTRVGDVRIYVSDCEALNAYTAWKPRRSPHEILAETHDWIHDNEPQVAAALLAG
jgi:CDP-paratose 2-epimerase